MTNEHYFEMGCPRCHRHLKVTVKYDPKGQVPYLASDLGGHHPFCASTPKSSGLGYSIEQSLLTLTLQLTPSA